MHIELMGGVFDGQELDAPEDAHYVRLEYTTNEGAYLVSREEWYTKSEDGRFRLSGPME